MTDREEAKRHLMLQFNKNNAEINRLADIQLKYGFLNTHESIYKKIGELIVRNKHIKFKIDNEFGDVVL